MPNIPVANCCGCTACFNICPNAAIEMQPDMEGFLFPRVDSERCVACGLCERVCPVLHPPACSDVYTDSVVVQSSSPEVLDQSTSGGFIDAVCRYVIEKKQGYAAGVAFDENFLPRHILVNTTEQTVAFRNSKYAQSDLNTVFRDIRTLLEQKQTVVFIGTPCQTAGLKAFLRGDDPNLITIDLVCRSIPSPKLWQMYLGWQEERHHSRVQQVVCRKKTYGYHSGALEITFANDRHYAGSNRVDYYMKSFHHNLCSRESCYQCTFKTKHRCTDLTVFDCWYPEKVAISLVVDNDLGFSNVIAHTEKGRVLLRDLNGIRCIQADPEKMFAYTGGMESQSVTRPGERDWFYQDLNTFGFQKTVCKYVAVSWRDWLIEAVKPVRYWLLRRIRAKR